MNNRHTISLAAAIATLLFSPHAIANWSKDGLRLTLSIGEATVKDRDGSDVFDASDSGWLAGLSYRLNENFAFGFAGGSLGTPSDFFGGEQTDIDVDIFDLYIEGILPLSDTFEIFGRFGRTLYTTELNGISRDLFGEDAGSFGAGATVDFNDRAALRGEYLYFNGPSDEEATMLAIGLQFQF